MGKRYLFVRRRRARNVLATVLAAAASGLVLGMLLRWKQPAAEVVPLATSQQRQPKSVDSDSGEDKTALVPLNEGLTQVISQLKQEVKAELTGFLPPKFQGVTLKEVKLPSKEKVIALTFDDGPWPGSTEKILKILKKNNIKATFFMVGEPLKEYPQIAQLVAADGHAIGNHTWHHWYHRMSEATAAREINDTEALIYKITGVKSSIFRPPGGMLNNGLVAYAKKQKYFVAMWSADSIDYRRPSVPTLVNKVLKESQPGGMVLLHDGGGDRSNTVQALPQIIDKLQNRGYKFVTIPELLEMQNKELQLAAAKSAGSNNSAGKISP
ncbi:MAG: polysaccharide deacetylase family protein [Aphanothece sp. CMT-3BRIN-NPC111]|nr:polysaccharide deacetylase family protein [Aphanothece sp. CMT-3BRIN-NPC111]